MLREFAVELAQPVCSVLNTSFITGSKPEIWKCANVSPLAEVNNIEGIGIDLRPISLTPTLSNIAKQFVVQEHVKPSVLRRLRLTSCSKASFFEFSSPFFVVVLYLISGFYLKRNNYVFETVFDHSNFLNIMSPGITVKTSG